MVEIIPKETAKLPGWLNNLLFIFLVVLLLSILSYFILNSFVKNASNALQGMTNTLNELRSQERSAAEREVLKYNNKIGYFFSLLDSHLENAKIFNLVERSTHPQIWFTKFNLSATDDKAIFSGKARDFANLGQQIMIFKQSDWVSAVDLQKVSISKEGNVDFELLVSIKSGILK